MNQVDLLIRGARVVSDHQIIEASVAIDGEEDRWLVNAGVGYCEGDLEGKSAVLTHHCTNIGMTVHL